MELGLCLSFCNKRWESPRALAEFVASLDIKQIQFSWDLVNPWWEEKVRNKLACEYAEAFRQKQIEMTISFSGMAAYAYSNLLSGDFRVREMGMTFFKRAVDMTAIMGISALGTPAGCMDQRQLFDNRKEARRRLADDLILLAQYASQKGLKQLYLEPTPVKSEIPNTASEAVKLMEELSGKTQIPIGLVLDWGHVLFQSFNEEPSDMNYWLSTCKGYVGACHIQQCDGQMDRHWGFSMPGIVTPEMIRNVLKNPDADGIVHYLEYCPAFETPNEEVIREVRNSVEYLHAID